jgi:hypothetical protein
MICLGLVLFEVLVSMEYFNKWQTAFDPIPHGRLNSGTSKKRSQLGVVPFELLREERWAVHQRHEMPIQLLKQRDCLSIHERDIAYIETDASPFHYRLVTCGFQFFDPWTNHPAFQSQGRNFFRLTCNRNLEQGDYSLFGLLELQRKFQFFEFEN